MHLTISGYLFLFRPIKNPKFFQELLFAECIMRPGMKGEAEADHGLDKRDDVQKTLQDMRDKLANSHLQE